MSTLITDFYQHCQSCSDRPPEYSYLPIQHQEPVSEIAIRINRTQPKIQYLIRDKAESFFID